MGRLILVCRYTGLIVRPGCRMFVAASFLVLPVMGSDESQKGCLSLSGLQGGNLK